MIKGVEETYCEHVGTVDGEAANVERVWARGLYNAVCCYVTGQLIILSGYED